MKGSLTNLLASGRFTLWLALAVSSAAAAQDASSQSDLAKKLQNPVADLISVPLQFNYDEKYGPKDAGRYTLNVQPVIPFHLGHDWNLITRTIVPVIYQESPARGVDYAFGLGDTVQSFFLSPTKELGGWILGAGPVFLWPTGTSPEIRSEQLGMGPTIVALQQRSGFTYGVLANHLWNLTDPDENKRVNATFFQPFLSYTWPTATTLTFNTEATYDWVDDDLTLPFNLMLSQILKLGGQPLSLAVGARYYAEAPPRGPEWGARFVVTLLFPK